MALKAFNIDDLYSRFKPQLLIVLAQIGYAFLYFITEASFEHGMNSSSMLPFAYYLEKKQRPKLTIPLFVEIFVLSFLGVGLTLNMYFASLRYTSPTFLASMVNTIASLTFIIAVASRLEDLDLGNPLFLAGAMTMTLYKGPIMHNLWHPLIDIHRKAGNSHESWLKGSILDCCKLHIMGVVSGLVVFIQLWCTEVKGPVFVTMFNPTSTTLVAILAYFVLGEKLYLGSILGAVAVIIGLYLLKTPDQSHSCNEEQEEAKMQSIQLRVK
ncbi:hypothetical protein MANES_15G039201v8 [Manihot esculenta]|uniref:Uncharacterized protein n=1 Tax=Manihot esculenta TaxID=3983 RepID=A0ACB7GA80_MANES|nr:hypothetical protein MANES_15G039201v8 [Manihot esculenta]